VTGEKREGEIDEKDIMTMKKRGIERVRVMRGRKR